MNRSKLFFPTAIFALLVFSGLTAAFAQTEIKPIEPSYDVTLHIIQGSNDGPSGTLPADLAGVSRELKSNFSFSSYRLADTFLGHLLDTWFNGKPRRTMSKLLHQHGRYICTDLVAYCLRQEAIYSGQRSCRGRRGR